MAMSVLEEKLEKTLAEYYALMFVLEATINHLQTYPDVVTDADSSLGDSVLEWQLRLRSKMKELKDKIKELNSLIYPPPQQ